MNKPDVPTTSTDLYDALSLDIKRIDSLAGLLEQRLRELDEQPDAPSELYALSLIAESMIDRLQGMLHNSRALYEHAVNLENLHWPRKGERGAR
jgi:hypothetical protein